MKVEDVTSDRLARADQIVAEASEAMNDFAEVFVDLSGVTAPIVIAG